MARFLVHWLATGLALAVGVRLLPAFAIHELAALLIMGAGVGLANAVVGPLLERSDIGLTPASFAMLLLVVNVAAFGILAGLLAGFPVGALWQIGLGGLLVTVVSWPLGLTRFVPRPDPV